VRVSGKGAGDDSKKMQRWEMDAIGRDRLTLKEAPSRTRGRRNIG